MHHFKCYEVLGNTDTTEGRGPMKVVARFSTKAAAMDFVKSKTYSNWCVMGYQNWGYDQNNIRETTLTILDNVEEFENIQRENLKASALAKLSKEERKALGL